MKDCAESRNFFDFVLEPGSEEGRVFARHLPGCRVCSDRIEAWHEIEEHLGVSGRADGPDHPDPQLLLELHESGVGAREELVDVAAHVDTCEVCRAELRALRRFNFVEAGRVAAAARGDSSAVAPSAERTRSRGGLLGWLSPAWGAAGLALAAIALLALLRVPSDDESAPIELVENRQPAASTRDGVEATAKADPATLASGGKGTPRGGDPGARPATDEVAAPGFAQADPPAPGPVPGVDEFSARTEVAATVDAGRPSNPEDAIRPAATERLIEDEWRLAAATTLPLPVYVVPTNATAFAYEGIRVRAEAAGGRLAEARILMPDHVSRTARPSPTVYWVADEEIPHDVEVTLVRVADGLVALEYVQPGPIPAALYEVDLGSRGVVIEEATEYRMYLSEILDPARRARDRRTAAALQRVARPSALPATGLEAARRGTSLGHEAARLGLWLDALDFFIDAAADEDASPAAIEMRDALLESADLTPIGP